MKAGIYNNVQIDASGKIIGIGNKDYALSTEITTATDNIEAFSGGGQESATILTSTYNIVETAAAANDSVKTDTGVVGNVREVANFTGNDINVYPASGEYFVYGTTDMLVDEAIVLADSNVIKLVCYTTGVYRYY